MLPALWASGDGGWGDEGSGGGGRRRGVGRARGGGGTRAEALLPVCPSYSVCVHVCLSLSLGLFYF